MTPEELSLLAKKYLSGQATDEEKKLLDEWYDNFDDTMNLDVSGEPGNEKDIEQKMNCDSNNSF